MVARNLLQPPNWEAAVIRALVVGALYFVVASATIYLTSDGRNNAAVWLADGIVLAALLDAPRRRWAPVLLAGLIANVLANNAMRGFELAHISFGLVNQGQILLAGTLVRKQPVKSLLADLGSLGHFVLWAGFFAPLIGAILGSLVSVWLYQQPLVPSFIRWFASNSLGFLVVTPLLKAAFDGSLQGALSSQTREERRNMAGALLIFTLVSHITFSQHKLPLLFLPVCALVLVAIWLGRIGVKFAVLILAVVATGVTIEGYGPLTLLGVDELRTATFFQIYLGVLLATGMAVVAIVTTRSDALARLADREQMLRQLLMHGKDVMLSFDEKGCCTFSAGPSVSLLGLPADEIVGRNIVELAQRVSMSLAMLDAQECALRPTPRSIEFQLTGQRRAWIEGTMTPIVIDERLSSSVVTLRDVTDQRVRQIDLKRRALTDELTQVSNRADFEARMEEALAENRPVTLALIDVDGLTALNDTFGQASGDEALVVVAEIIGAHVRQGDVVARIGGDEFAILFRGNAQAALAACRRICACIEQTRMFATDRRLMTVTISCGISELEASGTRLTLFEAAERALSEVKQSGRNNARLAA